MLRVDANFIKSVESYNNEINDLLLIEAICPVIKNIAVMIVGSSPLKDKSDVINDLVTDTILRLPKFKTSGNVQQDFGWFYTVIRNLFYVHLQIQNKRSNTEIYIDALTEEYQREALFNNSLLDHSYDTSNDDLSNRLKETFNKFYQWSLTSTTLDDKDKYLVVFIKEILDADLDCKREDGIWPLVAQLYRTRYNKHMVHKATPVRRRITKCVSLWRNNVVKSYEHHRKCPQCSYNINYTSAVNRNKAETKRVVCRVCAKNNSNQLRLNNLKEVNSK